MEKFTFEEIFKQNENRIHYHIHKLGIHDPLNEYYVEGIYALWLAYQKYQPNKGPLATYFNYMIKFRLMDMMRKNKRFENLIEKVTSSEKVHMLDGNHNGTTKEPLLSRDDLSLEISDFWEQIKELLTENQWKWVYYAIIKDRPLKEIAEQEGVSVQAVKGWSKLARQKLRKELRIEDLSQL